MPEKGGNEHHPKPVCEACSSHTEYGNVNRLKIIITKRSVKSSCKTGYAISV